MRRRARRPGLLRTALGAARLAAVAGIVGLAAVAGIVGLAAVAGIVGLAAAGCGPAPDEGPARVTGDFWAGLRAGDLEAARSAALGGPAGPGPAPEEPPAATTHGLAALAGRDLRGLELGHVLTGEGRAVVETRLPDPEPGVAPLVFFTHLERREAGWRVDADRTARALRDAEIGARTARAEDALRESGRAVGEALERGAHEASEALERALDALSEALRGATRPPPPGAPGAPDRRRAPEAPEGPGTPGEAPPADEPGRPL